MVMVIKSTSGGIGKNELSIKAIKKRAVGACLELDQWIVQPYIDLNQRIGVLIMYNILFCKAFSLNVLSLWQFN